MIKPCKICILNHRMNILLETMRLEKLTVNDNIGKDWNAVSLYGFRAASTMKALRKLNIMLKKIQ